MCFGVPLLFPDTLHPCPGAPSMELLRSCHSGKDMVWCSDGILEGSRRIWKDQGDVPAHGGGCSCVPAQPLRRISSPQQRLASVGSVSPCPVPSPHPSPGCFQTALDSRFSAPLPTCPSIFCDKLLGLMVRGQCWGLCAYVNLIPWSPHLQGQDWWHTESGVMFRGLWADHISGCLQDFRPCQGWSKAMGTPTCPGLRLCGGSHRPWAAWYLCALCPFSSDLL